MYITLKKVENCMTYHSLSSGKFNSPFKTFPDALTNCHCCKGYFKEGHAIKLKINQRPRGYDPRTRGSRSKVQGQPKVRGQLKVTN